MIFRRYLDVDGLHLSYLEQGISTPGTPSILMLHGLMGCAETMRLLIEEMPPNQHVIALDFPGAGHSERRPDLAATLAFKASVVHRVAAALHLDDFCLLGHSHGG